LIDHSANEIDSTHSLSGDARRLDADLISIITPVFNSEEYVEEAILSAQAQTYAKWEMLVLIDKGTKDRTAEIVQNLAVSDSRIRLIEVPDGRSVSDARNHGFSQARGRYIAFLDADDLWLPSKLEKQLRSLRESGAPLVYSGYRRISVDGSAVGREITVPDAVK
jgi:glycosyltransferase involved in cell wall biosynthesis